MKKEIKTNQAPAAIGPYSQAVALGNILYTSGQIPLDASGKMVEGDIRVQTQQVLKNLKAVVEAAGTKMSKTIKTTVFVTDLGQFSVINEEYEKFFKAEGTEIFPARSTVQVAALPRGVQVEVEAIVLLG